VKLEVVSFLRTRQDQRSGLCSVGFRGASVCMSMSQSKRVRQAISLTRTKLENRISKFQCTQPRIALAGFLTLSRIDVNKCPKVDFEALNTHEKLSRNSRYINNLPYLAVVSGVFISQNTNSIHLRRQTTYEFRLPPRAY
jgi:hypothetical protein